MIAAGDLQLFVPFGREHCRNHPNAFNLQLRELQPASELWSSDGAAGLVGSLQEVSLHERDRVRAHSLSIKQSQRLRHGALDYCHVCGFDRNRGSSGKDVWAPGKRMWSLKRNSTVQELWSYGAMAVAAKPPMCTRRLQSTAQCSKLVSKCFQEEILFSVEIATMSCCFYYLFSGLMV